MKRFPVLLFFALLCVHAEGVQSATNGSTTVFAFLLGGRDPVGNYANIPPSWGVMVTACDRRSDVLSFNVHLTGSTATSSLELNQVMGGKKNEAGCLTTWFPNTGKLTRLAVSADPVVAKIGETVTLEQ